MLWMFWHASMLILVWPIGMQSSIDFIISRVLPTLLWLMLLTPLPLGCSPRSVMLTMVVARTLDTLLVLMWWRWALVLFLELQASGTCCPMDQWGRVHCCSGSWQGNCLVAQSPWGDGLLCQFPFHAAHWQPVCHSGSQKPGAPWTHEAPGFALVLAEGWGGPRCYFTSVCPHSWDACWPVDQAFGLSQGATVLLDAWTGPIRGKLGYQRCAIMGEC